MDENNILYPPSTDKVTISYKPTRIHKLNPNKIKTLEDVVKILGGLNIQIALPEGTTSEVYENLKEYFD